jgi:hypothetical protein
VLGHYPKTMYVKKVADNNAVSNIQQAKHPLDKRIFLLQ